MYLCDLLIPIDYCRSAFALSYQLLRPLLINAMSSLPTIILDRDGVINYDSPHYIKSTAEWIPIPGSLFAISRLKSLGFQVSVATNQSGIARGLYTLDTLDAIHQKMIDSLSELGCNLDMIVYCPHLPSQECNCRKPKPGMLQYICNKLSVMPDNCIFVGDSMRDMQAADAANVHRCLVLTGNGKATLPQLPSPPSLVFKDLADFANHLIKIHHV